jgi:hypothetical protein
MRTSEWVEVVGVNEISRLEVKAESFLSVS